MADKELQISEDGWTVTKVKRNFGILTYRAAMPGPPMTTGVHSVEFKFLKGVAGVIVGVAREYTKLTSGSGCVCKSDEGWGLDACNGDLIHGAEGLGKHPIVGKGPRRAM